MSQDAYLSNEGDCGYSLVWVVWCNLMCILLDHVVHRCIPISEVHRIELQMVWSQCSILYF